MTIDSTPFGDRVAELNERARSGDNAWLIDRFAAGELSWLEPRLGADGYSAVGSAIDAGDFGLVRTILAPIGDPPTADEPESTITTFQPPPSATPTGVDEPESTITTFQPPPSAPESGN